MGQAGRWILVFLLAVAAGLGGYWLARRGTAPAESSSEPVSEVPVAPSVPTIPEKRPDITLADRDGKPRRLSEWDGKPQVINFWATWCAPCRREIPMLNALASDGRWPDLALIGIAIDFREDVLRYLESTPIDYTVLIGEQDGLDAARAFGVESLGLPFTAFVDASGRIVTIHVGELRREQADAILSIVRAVDSGEMDLETAQGRIRTQVPKTG